MCGCKDVMGTDENVLKQLKKLRGSKTVIVGIGNILKGDDGVGPLICQQLHNNQICAELIDAGTVPENYIQPIVRKAPQNLIVIDAIDFGAAPGTINIFDWPDTAGRYGKRSARTGIFRIRCQNTQTMSR